MRVGAVVLAAGRSTRYRAAGGLADSKLVDLYRGGPLVGYAVRAALGSRTSPVVVVTGHAREAVEAALTGLPILTAYNPDYASGLASSLRVGLAALGDVEAAVVLLGDMPLVEASTIERLIAAAEDAGSAQAIVPVVKGVRGNPVLLARSLFAQASVLEGDEGAKRLLRNPQVRVAEVSMTSEAVRLDIDEPPDFAR